MTTNFRGEHLRCNKLDVELLTNLSVNNNTYNYTHNILLKSIKTCVVVDERWSNLPGRMGVREVREEGVRLAHFLRALRSLQR